MTVSQYHERRRCRVVVGRTRRAANRRSNANFALWLGSAPIKLAFAEGKGGRLARDILADIGVVPVEKEREELIRRPQSRSRVSIC